MDRVTIYGTYHFIGFSLCEGFLEKGIRVYGYRFEQENEEFLDEKKMSIGRNANFQEKNIVGKDIEIEEVLDDEKTVIVLSLYDLYFSDMENPIPYFENLLIDMLKRYEDIPIEKLVCLLPINFLYDPLNSLRLKFNEMKENKIQIQEIYLPTVFGPWQPSVFLYQQFLTKDYLNREPLLNDREATLDAIYIKDAIEEIIQLIFSAENNIVQIQSKTSEQWLKGAQHLQLKDLGEINRLEKEMFSEENVNIIRLKESISIEEGLEIQKKHLSRLI
jgi:hypothetical protein